MFFSRRNETPSGSTATMIRPGNHFVSGRTMAGPFPEGAKTIYFGLGCFWGAERLFWGLEGVWVTAAGYAGGETANPTYKQVCTGKTGHTEAVQVVYLPDEIGPETLLKMFWQSHDPTQGNRQGNDHGTQYRSAIYWTDDKQRETVEASRATYERALQAGGMGPITTEIGQAGPFWYAEPEHQQYLAKNPGGYCGLAGTGIACPINSS